MRVCFGDDELAGRVAVGSGAIADDQPRRHPGFSRQHHHGRCIIVAISALRVKKKIGADARPGAVFKCRRPTGEVIRVDAPGRDPIVTRILWLEGTEPRNRRAFARCIYIHGTPEERNIGYPASYGCIRMRSADIIELFNTVGIGARVFITPKPLPHRP